MDLDDYLKKIKKEIKEIQLKKSKKNKKKVFFVDKTIKEIYIKK